MIVPIEICKCDKANYNLKYYFCKKFNNVHGIKCSLYAISRVATLPGKYCFTKFCIKKLLI